MKEYELTVILRDEEDQAAKGLATVKELLAKAGASIKKEEKVGSRELAYAIKKQNRGRYAYMELELDPQLVVELDKNFRLTPEILKFLFVKKA